jgi:hypothetical protein
MALRLTGFWEKAWPVLAGAGAAALILALFQFSSPHAFNGLERAQPYAYYQLEESYKPVQVRNELLGMITGIFFGVGLLPFIYNKTRIYSAVLVPVLLLFILSFSFWPFTIQKELLWLGMPFWAGISLAAFYSGGLIRQKIKRTDPAKLTA